jgi:hypothetical protein
MGSVAGQINLGLYDAVAESVRRRAANPLPALERASERGPSALPGAALAVTESEGRQIEALEQALPAGRAEMTLISHQQSPDRLVSDAEKAAFLRFHRGVTDSMSIIEDIKSGLLSYETVDALRLAHPPLYEMVKEDVREAIQGADIPPYAVLLELGIMFPEIPTHPSLAPGMIQMLQAPFMARETGSMGGQMSQGPGPTPQQPAPNLADLEKTRVQQIDSQ